MRLRLAQLSLATALAFGAVSGAYAQSKTNTAVVPVFYDKTASKPQAYLLLQPTDEGAQAGARWRFGGNELDAAFGVDPGNSFALLCSRKSGLSDTLANLAGNCAIGMAGDDDARHASATAAFGRNGARAGITAGSGRATLPAWLAPGSTRAGVKVNDLSVFAQKTLGRQGFVRIQGTTARAELVPAAELPDELADRWNSKTLTLGGGYGAFSANIIGHVVDVPGQQKWEGVGLGLTWRTPWSGQLTVGADNLVTRGKNPFSPSVDPGQDEGAIPYVRYEQDL